MKTNYFLLFIISLIHFQSSNAQKSQTASPKVENHLKGDLDYTNGALDLVQKQQNGEEINLGKIDTDGTIHFNLPEFDIKALYDSIPLQHYKFHNLFLMNSDCKDRDVFSETPFDDVYSQKTNAIFIQNYGIDVAVLEAANESLTDSNKYFWFYIDRAITFNDNCNKISSLTGDVFNTISANIKFIKGWNFIEQKSVKVNGKSQGDSLTKLKVQFSKISPANKKVKWTLRQIQEDEKIQTAKKLYNLTPISKDQFEKWVPNKLGDLSITKKEHGKPPNGQKNKNNIHLTYVNKTQNKEVDLYVVDCAKNPDDMTMINFAYTMENDGKVEKDIKPYIAQYSEQEKVTNLLYKVEDRIFVNATGVNINAEDLWDYIQKLNVEKLIK